MLQLYTSLPLEAVVVVLLEESDNVKAKVIVNLPDLRTGQKVGGCNR
jgi:hypothetical protein